MARTIIGVNDAKAVKRWSGLLAYDQSHKSYFGQRFMGKGADAEVPIQILTDLESDAGEQISYDLLAELTMAPVEGETTWKARGREAAALHRYGLHRPGTVRREHGWTHDPQTHPATCARRPSDSNGWWGRLMDELLFIYLSGSRGINPNFVLPLATPGAQITPWFHRTVTISCTATTPPRSTTSTRRTRWTCA